MNGSSDHSSHPFEILDNTMVHKTDFKINETSPVEAITDAIIEIKDEDLSDLPPLQERVNPDAIDMLIKDGGNNSDARVGIRFNYAECTVFIRDNGNLLIVESDEITEPQPFV